VLGSTEKQLSSKLEPISFNLLIYCWNL